MMTIYIFFWLFTKINLILSSIEGINMNTNDRFEVVYINEQIAINFLGCAKFMEDGEIEENKEYILLLGGFNEENYIDSALALNVQEMKIRDCELLYQILLNIPNFHSKKNLLLLKLSLEFKQFMIRKIMFIY
jgi:hypothetical protein